MIMEPTIPSPGLWFPKAEESLFRTGTGSLGETDPSVDTTLVDERRKDLLIKVILDKRSTALP
jgi:hypothetical protein